MPDTLEEEARRCPRCEMPGKLVKTVRKQFGERVETYTCENERCRWFDTTWIVQVRADGTIPQRKPGEKDFPEDVYSNIAGKAMVENLQDELQRGETRQPRR